MTYVLYHDLNDKVIRNSTLVQSGTEAFVDLMLYILGYLRVPVTYADNKEKMSYALAMYYQRCILCKDDMTAISQMCKKVSKLDPKKCEYLDMIFYPFYDGKKYVDINCSWIYRKYFIFYQIPQYYNHSVNSSGIHSVIF